MIHEQKWGSDLVPRAVIQSGVGWFYRGLAAKGTHMRAEKQAGQGRREQRIRKGWNTGLCLVEGRGSKRFIC